MDNNLSDINWLLKTVSATDATNDNNKVLKVVSTAPQTHTLNALTNVATQGYMLCPTKTILNGSFNIFLLQIIFTLSASSSTDFTLRAYLINSNYDEEILDIVFTTGETVKTTANQYRCVNNMEVISGKISVPSATLNAIPSGLGTNYEICRIISNATEKYNPYFMVPRGKKAKLSSIDYYRCANATPANIASDFSAQVFYRNASLGVSNTMFNYLQVSSPFSRTYNTNGLYNLEYGDSVFFYH